MNKVQQYVYEYVSHDGVLCREYRNFNVFHAHSVGETEWGHGLPEKKAQFLIDEWNAFESRAKGGGRYYLNLHDRTVLWPDVA